MKQILLTVFLIAFLLNSGFSQVEFTATTSKVVALGEEFALIFSVNNNPQGFTPPNLSDFYATGPSTSSGSSVEIINGKVTQSISATFAYYLRAKKEGKFTIGSAEVSKRQILQIKPRNGRSSKRKCECKY